MSFFASPRFAWTVIGAALMFAGWTLVREIRQPAADAAVAAPLNPSDARQQEILKANAGRPGDPDLVRQYAAINARNFGGALPPMAVRWEPALADVGPLGGQGFTLQGMFGRVGSESVILLNPVVRDDPRALERALCHEVVHAYLYSIGDESTAHGSAFQAVLRRLATEGAFEGIVGDADEKANLRAWLDAESARLDTERREMDTIDAGIKQTAADLEREIAAFNARADRQADEAAALEARRQQFNESVLNSNARIERGRDDLAHFNREVARYNLMMAYPDGLDEQSVMPTKPQRSTAEHR